MGLIANIRYGRKIFDVKKLARLVEAAYQEKARPSGHVQKRSFAPSSIGYKHHTCARKWVLAFRGGFFEENQTAAAIAIMDDGTTAHERIQGIFENAGILKEKELDLTTEDPPVHGFVDAIINLDDEDIVVEIKTTNNSNFVYRRNTNTPTPYHRYQLLLYMDALKINKGAFFYENRDSKEILIIPVEMNEKNREIIDQAKDWMREVYAAYKDDKLPTRAGKNNNSVICRECPLNTVCWETTPDGDIEIKSMPVYKDA